jgi:flagellin-like hook-associated protein FlgL
MNAWVPDSLVHIHDQLNQTSQQLASGKIGQTYSAFGGNVARSIDLHSKLAQIDSSGFGLAIANTSLSTANNALTSLSSLASTVASGTFSSVQATDATARTNTQSGLRTTVATMLNYLNTQDGDSYVFGGRAQGTPPALDVGTVLDGNPSEGKDGLSTYIAERQSADLGANGLGRLNLTLPAGGTTVSLTEEAANLPFGMMLKSVSSTLANASAALSTTSPKSLDVAFSGVPVSGTVLTVTLNLPDGTSTDVSLTAGATAGTNQFAVGTDAATTAANFQSALSTALKTTASTALNNVSALKASRDFFAGSLASPPQRVAIPSGGSAATATGFVTDPLSNAAHTVIWYQGTDAKASGDPRLDHVVQAAPGITIGLGVRGNEAGFSDTLAAVAAAAVMKFTTSDETLAQSQYSNLLQQAKTGLSSGKAELQTIVASLATSQTQIKNMTDQNTAAKGLYGALISTLEDASPEQTAAQVTQLQTQLQVAYQVTAKLMKMTLADYL